MLILRYLHAQPPLSTVLHVDAIPLVNKLQTNVSRFWVVSNVALRQQSIEVQSIVADELRR